MSFCLHILVLFLFMNLVSCLALTIKELPKVYTKDQRKIRFCFARRPHTMPDTAQTSDSILRFFLEERAAYHCPNLIGITETL